MSARHAHWITNHYFSVVLCLDSLTESFRHMYSTGRSSTFATWDKNGPQPSIWWICMQHKRVREVRGMKYGPLLSQKPIDTASSTGLGLALPFSEICQRADKVWKFLYKSAIVPHQTKVLSYLLFRMGHEQAKILLFCQFGDVPTHTPSGNPDSIPPPVQLHTLPGSLAARPISWTSGRPTHDAYVAASIL